jgi:hypothetical protein
VGGDLLIRCELCGKAADKHHIIHKCEGGLDFPMNYKYLCFEHHHGRKGPHKDNTVDLSYKLELKERLDELLYEDFYTLDKLSEMLGINGRPLRKLLGDCRLYKEGYKAEDIVFRLMGKRAYSEYMLEEYEDFVPIFNFG